VTNELAVLLQEIIALGVDKANRERVRQLSRALLESHPSEFRDLRTLSVKALVRRVEKARIAGDLLEAARVEAFTRITHQHRRVSGHSVLRPLRNGGSR